MVVTGTFTSEPATSETDVGTPTEKSLGWALTARVKLWVAGLPAPVAVMVIGYEAADPLAGVPASVAVPSWLSVKVTPVGREPVSDSAGTGVPVVVTVNVPAVPWVKVVVLAEVMAAGVLTVRAKEVVWVAPVPVPVTVTAYGPAGVAGVVVTVMVELPPEVTVAGENWAVAPVGRPLAVRPTLWGPPEIVAVLMVVVAGVPTTAVPEFGEAAMEKSPGGGGAAPGLNRAIPAAQYMAVVKVPVKLWAAVEVRAW